MTGRLKPSNRFRMLPLVIVAGLISCEGGTPFTPLERGVPTGEESVALARWSPGPSDSCTQVDHNAYAAVGPDGKLYPTWHPAVDPASGCTFGHEHGRDPRGSDIDLQVGDIPFGYANERLDAFDPLTTRHEDHVGHKIEWENDVQMSFRGAADGVFEARCHVMAKLHQGSHSQDAFTNNLHELVYHARCDEGTGVSFTVLTPIGAPGEFVRSCDSGVHVNVGTASPANSPSGGGKRLIPDRFCVEQHILVPDGERSNFSAGLRESWQVSHRLRRPDGSTLVSVNPYFNVFRPSRFHDPSQPNGVGRPMDVCYETLDGRSAQGSDCEDATGGGSLLLDWDDPRSGFRGAHRSFDINSLVVQNDDGGETWYTDPFGGSVSRQPFPGSIRQYVEQIDNSRGGATMNGPAVGRERAYGGGTVHAPN